MSDVLSRLQAGGFLDFTSLFRAEEGRLGVVVTFLAVLELIREKLIDVVQAEPFAPLHLKARASNDDAEPDRGKPAAEA